MYWLVLFLVFVSQAWAQVNLAGPCNLASIGGYVTDLNIPQMLGTWHQYARIANQLEVGDCSSAILGAAYGTGGAVSEIQIALSEVNEKTVTFYNGTLDPVTDVGGLYTLNLPGHLEVRVVVQATDYTNYAIFYSCTDVPATATTTATKMVLAWLFHRKETLTTAEQDAIKTTVTRNPDLADITWKAVSHTNTACGRSAAVRLPLPHLAIVLSALFVMKQHL